MFKKLFGYDDAAQMEYLQTRSIITIATLAITIPLSFFIPPVLGLIALVMLVFWGWGAVRALFGITAFGVILSGNIVVGVILFLFYIMAAYLCGIVIACLGVGRWLYLRAKYKSYE